MKPIIVSSLALGLAACQFGLSSELPTSVKLASEPGTVSAPSAPVADSVATDRGESLRPGSDSVGVLHEEPRRYRVQLEAGTLWKVTLYAALLSHDGTEIVEMRLFAQDGELLAESSLVADVPMGSKARRVETLSHEPAATGFATLELLCDECSSPVRYRLAMLEP